MAGGALDGSMLRFLNTLIGFGTFWNPFSMYNLQSSARAAFEGAPECGGVPPGAEATATAIESGTATW